MVNDTGSGFQRMCPAAGTILYCGIQQRLDLRIRKTELHTSLLKKVLCFGICRPETHILYQLSDVSEHGGHMFIYTVRANTLKFIGIISAAILALCMLIVFIPAYEPATTAAIAEKNAKYSYDKIKTEADVVSFLEQFGWTVEEPPLEQIEIRIPVQFDKVMNAYNELQKNQGLDLARYKDKDVIRYTYRITNYPDYSGTVYANVIVYKRKVIGGDICSSDVTGFINGFQYPEKK